MSDPEPPNTPATSGKASFADIYDRADPRAYFRGLGTLDYQAPAHGQRVFRTVLDALPSRGRPTVVDLCCSYGVNGALLKHHLRLDDLYAHYGGQRVDGLSRDELVQFDRAYYGQRLRSEPPRVIGIDVSAPAVAYAVDAGLLDVGAAEDLESDTISPRLAEAVAGADLITVTGGVGYITGRTFEQVLDCTSPDRRPWVAVLCLRTVPYAPVAAALAGKGLVTERLEGRTYPQRRFASEQERDSALRLLAERGLDPTDRESQGSYHVDVHLSRPPGEVARRSIDEVLGSPR